MVVMLPLSIGGLHASGDLSVYLSFAREFQAAILNGDLYPGWANDNLGFGSVGIRFYPPIAPYVSAIISLLTNSWYYTVWIYFVGWMIAGCSGVYLLVREWGTPVQGLIAGMFYAIVPFNVAEIYQFSLYAEFAAGAIIPFCFLFISRICHRQKWTDVLLLSVSFALLILTHIPTTIITSICFLVYVPFLIERQFIKKTIPKLATAVGLALLASAFYWIKVITEVQWLAHYDNKYSSGWAGYEQWLFPISLLRGEAPYFYYPIFRNLDAIIVLTALLLTPFFILLLSKRRSASSTFGKVGWASAVTSMFAFFMLSRASSFIWSGFTLLQKIQFPWRWLTVLSVAGISSFILSIFRLYRLFPRYKPLIALCSTILLSLMVAYDIRQSFLKPNRISRIEFESLLDEKNSPSGSSYTAWWPVWAKEQALDQTDQVVAGGREVEISDWEGERRHFQVGEGPATILRMATFYYPYWRASINGKSVDVDKDDNGAITIALADQRSDIYLQFEEPGLNYLAVWVSAVTWGMFLILGIFYVTRSHKPRRIHGEAFVKRESGSLR